MILANDNWRATQEAEIMATGLQPTNDLESALVMTLQPGSYTALLQGNGGATGVGLVEIYALAPPGTPSPTPVPTPSATPTPTPTPVPTPSQRIFIANGGNSTVSISSLDGSGGTALTGNLASLISGPQMIAINSAAGKMYVANTQSAAIIQANLDGTGAVNLALSVPLNNPYGIALDVAGNKIYISNAGDVFGANAGIGFVVRADLDGTNAARLTNMDAVLATQRFPVGMAINVAGNKMLRGHGERRGHSGRPRWQQWDDV